MPTQVFGTGPYVCDRCGNEYDFGQHQVIRAPDAETNRDKIQVVCIDNCE